MPAPKNSNSHRSIKEIIRICWEYYRTELFLVLFLIIALLASLLQAGTGKDEVLRTVFLNVSSKSESSSDYLDSFMEHMSLDTNKYCINSDTSMQFSLELSGEEATYAAFQKIVTLLAAGEIDIFAADPDAYLHFSHFDYFTDLRDVLTKEQLSALSAQLFYIDGAVLREKLAADRTENLYTKPYPNPLNPAAMEDPIPVGIVLNKNSAFMSNFTLRAVPPYLA